MKRAPPISQADMLAKLLDMHNRDRWPNAYWGMSDSPMRRALRKAGYIELRPHRPGTVRLTAAGRALLVDVPGSGIYTATPL